MEDRTKKLTADGSYTLFEPGIGATYHSIYGAVQESRHVYVVSGLQFWLNRFSEADASIRILDVGFGTGLNALLTLEATEGTRLTVEYHAIEPFPLNAREWLGLNYPEIIQRSDLNGLFMQLHQLRNGIPALVSPGFELHRQQVTIQEFTAPPKYNLLYFDVFAPDVQPELWTMEVFRKLFGLMVPGGILVTYSSKGAVRRGLAAAGFTVEKLPGPAHKREMTRAVKS